MPPLHIQFNAFTALNRIYYKCSTLVLSFTHYSIHFHSYIHAILNSFEFCCFLYHTSYSEMLRKGKGELAAAKCGVAKRIQKNTTQQRYEMGMEKEKCMMCHTKNQKYFRKRKNKYRNVICTSIDLNR